jgi:hypothetical protein
MDNVGKNTPKFPKKVKSGEFQQLQHTFQQKREGGYACFTASSFTISTQKGE